MAADSYLKSFSQCRLCGTFGMHEIDISESDSSFGPNNPNALSEKIFQCVGIRVKKKDKLTTKICKLCAFKIDEFVVFRKKCDSTNIRLRIELSNVMGDSNENADTSFEDLLLNDEGIDVTIAANVTQDSDRAEKRENVTSKSNNSSSRDERASPNHCELPPATSAHQRCPKTGKATPTMCISLSDTDSEDEEGDAYDDDTETHKKIASAKKRKSAGNNVTITHQKCEFRLDCNAKFETWDAMIYHGSMYHAEGIKNKFECFLCKRSFKRLCYVKRHIVPVHTGQKPFKCRTCLRHFGWKSALRAHIRESHSDIKRFQCPDQSCLKSFKRNTHLQKHIDGVHCGLRPYKCTDQSCSKGFSEGASLKRHMDNVHSGLRPYKCTDQSCLKSYKRNTHLQKHIDGVHCGLRPYKCTDQSCSKSFSQKANLMRHMNNGHSKKRSDSVHSAHQAQANCVQMQDLTQNL